MSEELFSSISVEDLYKLAQTASKLHFLDVREIDEFEEVHAPSSRNVPLSRLMEGRARDDLRMPKEEPIYLICRSGRRSATACELLAQQGHTSLYNVLGGIEAWKKAGLPIASR